MRPSGIIIALTIAAIALTGCAGNSKQAAFDSRFDSNVVANWKHQCPKKFNAESGRKYENHMLCISRVYQETVRDHGRTPSNGHIITESMLEGIKYAREADYQGMPPEEFNLGIMLVQKEVWAKHQAIAREDASYRQADMLRRQQLINNALQQHQPYQAAPAPAPSPSRMVCRENPLSKQVQCNAY